MNTELVIGGQPIGIAAPPYVIAEAGSNFNQSLDTARRLIDVAANARANAVKFQLFRSDVLYPNGGELYDIFKSVELSQDWVPILKQHAEYRGLTFLASAFDRESVDLLDALGVAAHKVASSETTNLGFLHYMASRGKPLIVSTGMCDMVDVQEAVNICIAIGNTRVGLLQCGALYPLVPEQANLRVIPAYATRFGCPVGFSDHTLGFATAVTAIGLGASIFEKHFTLDRNSRGPDHFYAMEPKELESYIALLRESHSALGSSDKQMLPQEREVGRREGLYAVRDLAAGETLHSKDIALRCPAVGLRARYSNVVIGAQVLRPVAKDQPLTWELLGFGAR